MASIPGLPLSQLAIKPRAAAFSPWSCREQRYWRQPPRPPGNGSFLAFGDSVAFGFIVADGFAYVDPDNFVGYPNYVGDNLRLHTAND
jgi:hypothetical protein